MVVIKKIKHIASRIKGSTNNSVLIGVFGVLAMFFAITSMVALSSPWSGSGDSRQHLDYVWQFSQGDLPSFSEGIQYGPIKQAANNYDVQHVSQHPPLFYMLLAPFLVHHLDAEQWEVAVGVGRLLSVGIGLVGVIAFSWAGYCFGGERRRLFMVALPAIAMFHGAALWVSSDIRGDMLPLLFTILSFIFIYQTLKDGPSRKNIITLSILSVLGMSSRVTFLATLIVILVAVVLSFYQHRNKTIKALFTGVIVSTGMLSAVVASIGWFYYFHNYLASGSYTRSGPQSWISGEREYKTFKEVIFNKDLYTSALQIYGDYYNHIIIAVLSVIIVSAGVRFIKRANKHNRQLIISVVSLFLIHYAIVAAGQIMHAVGYGQFSTRYFLPGLLFLALVLAYGLLSWRRFRGQLITLFVLVNTAVFIGVHTKNLEQSVPAVKDNYTLWERMAEAFMQNGIPSFIVLVLVAIFIAGTTLLANSLWRLSNNENTKPHA